MHEALLTGGDRCAGSRQRGRNTRALVHWAPRWRRLLTPWGEAPEDFTEFDRTVRGMLNRISRENACRILPLDPSLRGAELAAGDCPPWWAARFAALMLSSYLQVINTNRHARGLTIGGSDNVLAGYLDAVAPLLVKSPRLVTALLAWLARLLNLHDLWWPTTRLLLLAARGDEDRDHLPLHALGRLPADIIRGRILGFLVPPRAPAIEGVLNDLATLQGGVSIDGEKDIVAVLVHLLMFSPSALWPRFCAFGFSLAEAALAAKPAAASNFEEHRICDDGDTVQNSGTLDEGDVGSVCMEEAKQDSCDGKSAVSRCGRTSSRSRSPQRFRPMPSQPAVPGAQQLYLAASIIAILAQRIKQELNERRHGEDLGPMRRLAERLRELRDLLESPAALRDDTETVQRRSPELLPPFVSCRIQAALEHALPAGMSAPL